MFSPNVDSRQNGNSEGGKSRGFGRILQNLAALVGVGVRMRPMRSGVKKRHGESSSLSLAAFVAPTDRKVASCRGDGGWSGNASGRRKSAGWCGFTCHGERISALRAGSMVRAGSAAAPEGPCIYGPLCRRLRGWVHRRRGRPASDGCATKAFWRVRSNDPPGQDSAGVFPKAPGRTEAT